MEMTIMWELDREVEKCVNEMQKKHKCLIFLKRDCQNVYMDVLFVETCNHIDNICLCNASDSRYACLVAMRQYFRGLQ